MILEKLPEIVTVKELAEALRISEQKIMRALKSGSLKGLKVVREWRIPKEEVLKWINTQ